jgi:hypothetical protein
MRTEIVIIIAMKLPLNRTGFVCERFFLLKGCVLLGGMYSFVNESEEYRLQSKHSRQAQYFCDTARLFHRCGFIPADINQEGIQTGTDSTNRHVQLKATV